MADSITFAKAVMQEFKRPEDSAFTKEYGKLTDDDKRDLYHGFRRMGLDVQAPLMKSGAPVDVSENPRNY